MDLDRRQRNDIDIVSEDHLTLALDALNIVNSPYVIDLEDYTGNNWLIVSEKYTKYNVVEEDMLGFMVDRIPDLAQKNITEMILGFDYTAADNMIISNVSFSHDDMAELELVNYAINGTGHVDISCDIFGLDEEVLNNIIVNQGFIIGINFNGDNSNASLKIWNVKLSFKFTNKLLGESNSVVNRLVPQVDFWREDDKLYLQIGDGSGRGHVDEQYIDTYTKDEIDSKLAGKVNVEIGKGLSSNDYTLTEKNKLASVEANANYYTHPSSHNSSIIINSDALTNLDTSANATQSEINQAIDDTLGNKQDGLISGENIKTINNNSILGSGNITIQGGSNVDIVTSWGSTTSDSKVPSEKLAKNSLDDKISKSSTSGLVKNDGTIDTTTYSTFSGSYADLSNKPSIPSKISDLTNDSNFIETSSTSGLVKNDGSIDTTTYSTFSGSYNDLSNKPTIPANVSDLNNDSGFITSSSLPTKTSDLQNDGDGTNAFLTQHQSLSNYIQKSNTNGLLKNDGSVDTTSYSTFSGSYNDLSNKPTIPAKISDLTNDSDFIEKSNTSGLVKNDGSIDTTTYSTFSGSYNDLSNKPTIPSKISDLTNDSDFIEKSNTSGLIKNDGSIDTTSYITSSAITGKEDTNNKVASWSSTPSDTHYPSEKLVADTIDSLVSNDRIMIIPSRTYLASGDKTDFVVKLTNGLGQPLTSKSVTVTDGTNTYTGITDTDGEYVLLNIGVTGDTTFTANYGTIYDTCTIKYCTSVDWGTSNLHNDIWGTSNFTLTRENEYTLLTETSGTGTCTLKTSNMISPTQTIEFDLMQVDGTTGYAPFYIRNEASNSSLTYATITNLGASIGEWVHIKIVFNNTSTVMIYTDKLATPLTKTLSATSTNYRLMFYGGSTITKLKFKNVIIY